MGTWGTGLFDHDGAGNETDRLHQRPETAIHEVMAYLNAVIANGRIHSWHATVETVALAAVVAAWGDGLEVAGTPAAVTLWLKHQSDHNHKPARLHLRTAQTAVWLALTSHQTGNWKSATMEQQYVANLHQLKDRLDRLVTLSA